MKDMLVDGVIGGVGAVIVFLPQILILYFFISYMEDSGYMARAAFIMDKLMHKMGLHGKSFIPLIMGFGCNVPAVMATRTIESQRSRLITMLILPLMSCSARLPIYIMVIGTFFAIQYRSLIMVSLYLIGIFLAVILSRIFASFVVKGEDTPFVMELPPYRFPTWKAIGRHTWEKGKQYLKKMGGIILVASIIVWALGYFPHNEELDNQAQQEQSYIGRIGKAIEPIFTPQGFDWKLDVGLVSGVGAKMMRFLMAKKGVDSLESLRQQAIDTGHDTIDVAVDEPVDGFLLHHKGQAQVLVLLVPGGDLLLLGAKSRQLGRDGDATIAAHAGQHHSIVVHDIPGGKLNLDGFAGGTEVLPEGLHRNGQSGIAGNPKNGDIILIQLPAVQ